MHGGETLLSELGVFEALEHIVEELQSFLFACNLKFSLFHFADLVEDALASLAHHVKEPLAKDFSAQSAGLFFCKQTSLGQQVEPLFLSARRWLALELLLQQLQLVKLGSNISK